MGNQVRAEFVVNLPMLTFAEEMKIELAERWGGSVLVWFALGDARASDSLRLNGFA